MKGQLSKLQDGLRPSQEMRACGGTAARLESEPGKPHSAQRAWITGACDPYIRAGGGAGWAALRPLRGNVGVVEAVVERFDVVWLDPARLDEIGPGAGDLVCRGLAVVAPRVCGDCRWRDTTLHPDSAIMGLRGERSSPHDAMATARPTLEACSPQVLPRPCCALAVPSSYL